MCFVVLAVGDVDEDGAQGTGAGPTYEEGMGVVSERGVNGVVY